MKRIGWFVLFFLWTCQTANAEFDLQFAIDQAKPGEIVHIPAGRYQGNFTVKKSIKLQGEKGVELYSQNTEPALKIDDTANVSVEDIMISAKNKGIVVNEVENLKLKAIEIKDVQVGIHIQRSKHIQLLENKVVGNQLHYAEKGNGIAVFKSEDIAIEHNAIDFVQDGIYVEEVRHINVRQNEVTNSRYGTHFMYSSDVKVLFNSYLHNVTGLMVMMTTDLEIASNTISNHNDFNSYGLLMYDTQQAKVRKNSIRNNRVGVAMQKCSVIQIQENGFQMNQTALEGTKVDNHSIINDNQFTGNILTARSDQQGLRLVRNFYDDYRGIDVAGDGFGDVPYVAVSSFGQWMVRQPVYQFFVASPSVMILTSLDQQVNKTEQNLLVDNEPMLIRHTKEKAFSINILQFIIGLVVSMSGFWLWKRGV
ncbi:right-handed parallel beta-helix repeat-containing protein [Lysinibacillus fusiformis]|uniref:right-handed parallel beta-helix repeat-containing protein n=1 Tax=Lysinibacillus fusiformis TaxID=28031 RepID=UPI00215B119E|nr:NosD domain-containing protein [Lysinibacillus fusiformis]MCR8855252.1 right-handed parallel beta-helix repeat-containing protein [Lysinibacillus fusiformis]